MALSQNAVTRPANTRAHEQLLYVLKPAWCAVQKIFAAAVTKNSARQRHFVIRNFNARRLQTFFADAAKRERDFAHAHRLATVGAVEDHVGHFAAAQCLGRLFAEHPADGIGDVGFATTVWSNNGGNTGLKIQRRLVREGLKTKNCEIFEIHKLTGSSQPKLSVYVKRKTQYVVHNSKCSTTNCE